MLSKLAGRDRVKPDYLGDRYMALHRAISDEFRQDVVARVWMYPGAFFDHEKTESLQFNDELVALFAKRSRCVVGDHAPSVIPPFGCGYGE